MHTGIPRDLGHIYTRELEEEFISAPLRWAAGERPRSLHWKGPTPHGSALTFQFRSAGEHAELTGQPWRGAAGPGSRFETSGAALEVPPGHTWGQYRAVFASRFGAGWPTLEEVTVAVE